MARRRANGAGSIWRWRDGRLMAQLSLGDGRRRSHLCATRAEAERWLLAARKAAKAERARGDRRTVGDYLAEWLRYRREQLAPASRRRYESLLRRHALPELGALRLAQLGPAHLAALYARLRGEGLAPRTVGLLHTALGSALRTAEGWGLVARNPARLVRPPRPARYRPRVLSPEEARRLLDAARGDPLEALYVLALTSGLRLGELLGLRWADVDLGAGMLRVERTAGRDGVRPPKTAAGRRTVALPALAMAALAGHRGRQRERGRGEGTQLRPAAQPRSSHGDPVAVGPPPAGGDYVFSASSGAPLDGNHLRERSFRPLLARAGLAPMRFHDLRHTSATLLLALDTPLKVLSARLGHSGIAITADTYLHPDVRMERAAMARLDALLAGDGEGTQPDRVGLGAHGSKPPA